jgi:hypothetical protein
LFLRWFLGFFCHRFWQFFGLNCRKSSHQKSSQEEEDWKKNKSVVRGGEIVRSWYQLIECFVLEEQYLLS